MAAMAHVPMASGRNLLDLVNLDSIVEFGFANVNISQKQREWNEGNGEQKADALSFIYFFRGGQNFHYKQAK